MISGVKDRGSFIQIHVQMDSSTFNISILFSWYFILPALCTFLYWHFTKTFNHWKNRKIFHLKPVILFGNIKDRVLFRKSFHEFQLNVYNKLKGNKIAGKLNIYDIGLSINIKIKQIVVILSEKTKGVFLIGLFVS